MLQRRELRVVSDICALRDLSRRLRAERRQLRDAVHIQSHT
jgi:hypothetical protein